MVDFFTPNREHFALPARFRGVPSPNAPGGTYYQEEVSAAHSYALYTLLDAVSGVTTGQPFPIEGRKFHTFHTLVSGAVTSFSIAVEGSLDGVNWFNVTTITGGGAVTVPSAFPVLYVRGKVTAFSGTGAITVLGLSQY